MVALDTLSQRIRALRIEKGMSQQQLADILFVTRKTISNWESGARIPDVAMLSRLAKALDVKTHELIDVIGDPDSTPVVIVVEDEPIILKGFLHILCDTLPDLDIFGFQTSNEALKFAEGNRIDIAFLDVELFGESGIDLAEKLSLINPQTNIIFLTGHSEYTGDALKLHCSGYILKPLTPEKIREEIAHLRFPVRSI